MLAQLSRQLPTVQAQVGTGEAAGLPDHTADLITFAQSWHWVEPSAGSIETARVLKTSDRAGWVPPSSSEPADRQVTGCRPLAGQALE